MLPAAVDRDRHLPAEYSGELAPNYFCRGWNAKRLKYCGSRAGRGTDHPGVGRCKNHGGATPVRSGIYSVIRRPRIAELVAQFEALPETEALRTFPELAAARALFVDWVERYDEVTAALLAWHASYESEDATPKPRQMPDLADGHRILETISRIADRVIKARDANAIGRKDFFRVMTEMGRVVELWNEEPDPARRLQEIKRGWTAIRLA